MVAADTGAGYVSAPRPRAGATFFTAGRDAVVRQGRPPPSRLWFALALSGVAMRDALASLFGAAWRCDARRKRNPRVKTSLRRPAAHGHALDGRPYFFPGCWRSGARLRLVHGRQRVGTRSTKMAQIAGWTRSSARFTVARARRRARTTFELSFIFLIFDDGIEAGRLTRRDVSHGARRLKAHGFE